MCESTTVEPVEGSATACVAPENEMSVALTQALVQMGRVRLFGPSRIPPSTIERKRVRPLDVGQRDRLVEILKEWGLPIVSTSGTHDPAGFACLSQKMTECEVITLNSPRPGHGVGTALLSAVRAAADRNGLRLRLITTDDDPDASDPTNGAGYSREPASRFQLNSSNSCDSMSGTRASRVRHGHRIATRSISPTERLWSGSPGRGPVPLRVECRRRRFAARATPVSR